jgi:hypothetical protein
MFCFARNFDLRNDETSRLLYEGSKATFLEDAVILEAEQKNLCGGDISNLIDLTADAAQLRARRMLKQLIEKEQAI